ncbi:hypothetical protein IAU60_003498 [Kwoniella sp. DSM 27419]
MDLHVETDAERPMPSPRIPYKAILTPPTTPSRLHRAPSYHRPGSRSATPQGRSDPNDYPESPTSSKGHHAYPFPPTAPFTLGQTPPSRRRPPRFLRSPKQAGLYLLLLSLILLGGRTLSRWLGPGGIVGGLDMSRRLWERSDSTPVDDGLCRFVSTVEAYHRDLARLRGLHPPTSNISSTASKPHHKHQHHTFSPTGHLVVSSSDDAPHPIPVLLSLGEKRWEELLSRQSRTLEEAVREYTKRYGRRPPKGFDAWWDFAMTHNLVLPDEYDRINLDLAPFFALPKAEMKRRMQMVEHMAETFTLVVEDGEVDIEIRDQGGLKWGGTLPRARDASSLLSAFSEYLPNMRATFSIFDQPQIYLSWARRGSLVDLGLRGEHTTHLEETDAAYVKLSRSCAPDSHYRKNQTYSEGKSFIYDSLEGGDLCQNPYLIPLHGLTLEPHGHDSHPRPHTQLLPLFSLAKTSINSDILITPLDQFFDQSGEDPAWEDKVNSKLVWRGSPTGISMMTKELDWRSAHRVRLHQFAANRSTEPMSFLVPDLGQRDLPYDEESDFQAEQEVYIDSDSGSASQATEHAGPTDDKQPYDPDNELLSLHGELPTDEAMDFYFDMKLAGEPIQCSEEDGTCDEMRVEIEWAGHQGADEMNLHKFMLDIDGNGWSGRFRRLMGTNSMVIKMTMFTEWFQPHLIPWFMYVPAKLDFSDLTDIMAFFRGTPKHPELGFDETAAALARNGQCFVQRMFRMEDLQAYMMRLFLEYARITADEGVDMDYYYEEDEGGDDQVTEGDDESGSGVNANANAASEGDYGGIAEDDRGVSPDPDLIGLGRISSDYGLEAGEAGEAGSGQQRGDQVPWDVGALEMLYDESRTAYTGIDDG